MILVLLSAMAPAVSTCVAQTKTGVPLKPNRQAAAQDNVRGLLLLMDTNKNGKISKAEWMNFMSAEFDRLDTDHSGELDPNELEQSPVYLHLPPAIQGK